MTPKPAANANATATATLQPAANIKPPASYPKTAAETVEQKTAEVAATQGEKPAEGTQDLTAIARQAIAEQASDLKKQLDGIAAGLSKAGQPVVQSLGGPAVVRRSALGTGVYSFTRALQCVSGLASWNDCAVEGDMHNRLHTLYHPAMQRAENGSCNGVLMPLSSAFIGQFDQDFGQEIHEQSIAGVSGLDIQEVQAISKARVEQGFGGRFSQALSIYDDKYLGAFISFAEAGEMISLLRPLNIFMSAGARQVQFLPNGTYPMLRHTAGMTGFWVGKGRTDNPNRAVTVSNPNTGAWNLTPKKCGCAIHVPGEFAKFGASSVESFIRMDMADTLGQTLDDGLMFGEGGLEPMGLVYHDDLIDYEALLGDDGDFFRTEDIEYMVAEIQEQDVPAPSPTFVTRPRLAARIQMRRASAIESMDSEGPLVALDMAMNGTRGGNRDSTLGGYRLVRSTKMRGTLTKGDGTGLSEVLCGQFTEYVLATLGAIEFSMTDSHGELFLSGVKTIMAVMYADGAARRGNAFALCQSLIQDDTDFVASSP